MQIALMTYEGKHHATVEWDGKFADSSKFYLKLPGDLNNFTAVLAIRPEDVEMYTETCRRIEEQMLELQHELRRFKVNCHRQLMPLDVK